MTKEEFDSCPNAGILHYHDYNDKSKKYKSTYVNKEWPDFQLATDDWIIHSRVDQVEALPIQKLINIKTFGDW